MQDIPRASIKELAHKIKAYNTPRFAFLLGAGASRQSGIPIAAEMIRYFKEQIILQRGPDGLKTDEEKERWLAEQDWYRAEGSVYCKCFERFEPKEIGRQRYIESIIEKREPSFGYVVLANLMAQGFINTIITTNFDDLVYSACTTFTGIRPIVYAYGVMASEMRFTAQRPKILKLHGDYLYSALKNTGPELAAQDPNMLRQLRQVLSEYGLIVIGYAGGDTSVMNALSEISERQDLYWCVRRGEKNLHENVQRLLREKGGYLVEIDGFDEMMNEVRRVVEFDVRKMLGSIEERRSQLIKHLQDFDMKFSADILGDIVDAAKNPTAEGKKEKDVSALDYFLQAYKAQEAKEYSEAETLYRKAIELDPGYATAYNNLGAVLRDSKRYAEAETALRKSIELDPDNSLAYNNLGAVLGDLKRHEEAETAIRKAIELDPDYATAYNNLGGVLRDSKRYAEAEAVLRKSIKLAPGYALAYNNLGNVLGDSKRYAEAEAVLRKSIELDPDYATAYNNLGAVLRDSKRYAEAETALRKSIELDPDNSFAYNNLGNVLRDLNRHEEAETAYRKSIELDPGYVHPYNNLCTLLRLWGKEEEALRWAEEAHRLDAKSISHFLNLVAIQKNLGDATKANQYAEQAREVVRPDDWYNLACLEAICGNTDAAIEHLRRAAEQPTFECEWAAEDPDLESLRDDPRFKEIVGGGSK